MGVISCWGNDKQRRGTQGSRGQMIAKWGREIEEYLDKIAKEG